MSAAFCALLCDKLLRIIRYLELYVILCCVLLGIMNSIFTVMLANIHRLIGYRQ